MVLLEVRYIVHLSSYRAGMCKKQTHHKQETHETRWMRCIEQVDGAGGGQLCGAEAE